MRLRAAIAAGLALIALASASTFAGPPRGATPARASSLSALQLADQALSSIVGPDDEGSYRLIDPIGPGGVNTLAAANEVYASHMLGGQYSMWGVEDPFAQPNGPPAQQQVPPLPYGLPRNRLR